MNRGYSEKIHIPHSSSKYSFCSTLDGSVGTQQPLFNHHSKHKSDTIGDEEIHVRDEECMSAFRNSALHISGLASAYSTYLLALAR